MYKNTGLRFRILEAPLVNKGFVKNEEKCNYELYLVEMLNQSNWFSLKYKNPFIWSSDQAHGECDAYSGEYGLDFKLIASTTELLARNVHSVQIAKEGEGIIRFYEKNPTEKPTTVTHVFFVVKNQDITGLEQLRSTKTRKYGVEKDVNDFLNLLEKKKNLMLFFCYRFYFKNNTPDNAVDIIKFYLQEWYKSSFEYRKKYCPDFDTFVITIFYDDFIIMKVNEIQLEVIDIVSANKCPTYMLLKNYYQDNLPDF